MGTGRQKGALSSDTVKAYLPSLTLFSKWLLPVLKPGQSNCVNGLSKGPPKSTMKGVKKADVRRGEYQVSDQQ